MKSLERKFSQKLRNKLFWFRDFLKGGKITNHYNNISNILSQSKLQKKSNPEYLTELLHHAKSTVPYYRNHNTLISVIDFPIVNKQTIKNNLNQFISQNYKQSELIPVVTSGSTGTPFMVYHDMAKKQRNTADTIYFAQLSGFEVGDRLAYLKIWAKEKLASPLQYSIQNIIPIDVIQMTDDRVANLIIEMEANHSVFGILGYVSAMERICKYLDRSGKDRVKASVSSIITMSESLTDYVKNGMEKYFGCAVQSRYSNLENGIIAQQIPGSDGRYLVNTASYLVEIFKIESDMIAQDGEIGRIVVTDLFNYAMPMIRYDTGDIGSISKESDNNNNTYLEQVEGRKLDLLFATDGSLVSSYIVYKNMWKYMEIEQYQLIQEEKTKYVFRINAKDTFNKESQLISEFKTYLGNDADFKIEYVNEIPLLSSGKRKKIVNNYKKNA
jgi:phenylacetate-CoA ligase